MMCTHEFIDLSTEVYEADKEEKYRYHKDSTICSRPLSEGRVVSAEILCLKYRKATDDEYEKHREETRLWYTKECISRHGFAESFLEHFESRKEDDEESDPLDRWVFLQESADISRRYDHEYDRDDESDHEIYDISMAGSCDCEYVIEWHRDISDDDRLDSCTIVRSAISCSLFVMLMSPYLSIELPYHIEEEYRSEELKSRNLEEKYDPEGKYDTEDRRTCYSPKYCFFSHFWREIFGRHTDEDSIVSAHDEVDEDDIEQSECSCRSEEMEKIWFESREKFEHKECVKKNMCVFSRKSEKMQWFFDSREEEW